MEGSSITVVHMRLFVTQGLSYFHDPPCRTICVRLRLGMHCPVPFTIVLISLGSYIRILHQSSCVSVEILPGAFICPGLIEHHNRNPTIIATAIIYKFGSYDAQHAAPPGWYGCEL